MPARVATLDADGYPHVTPLWFVWADGAFHMTSFAGRPHLRRLASNPRAGVCVDIEDEQREDGERPNRRLASQRIVIRLEPQSLIAVASV